MARLRSDSGGERQQQQRSSAERDAVFAALVRPLEQAAEGMLSQGVAQPAAATVHRLSRLLHECSQADRSATEHFRVPAEVISTVGGKLAGGLEEQLRC